MSTANKSVLVVGASRGIGRATAAYLAAQGFRVYGSARKADDVAQLSASDPLVHGVQMDVTDDASIEAARSEIETNQRSGDLDGLVYCAAPAPGGGLSQPMEHVTRTSLALLFDVTPIGMAMTIRAFAPMLRKARGRIVNIGGGGSAVMAMPLMGAGSASKFAVEALTDALRLELRRSGVRVSLVEPGMTYSSQDAEAFHRDMHADLDAVAAGLSDANREYYGPIIENQRRFIESWLDRAAPPERVAKRIHHALTARRPRTRYWCGWESKMALLLSRISSGRMRDRLWGRMIGL